MAIYKVRIDEDLNKEFYLTEWNLNNFNSNYTLNLQTSNLELVKNSFAEFNKIEILLNNDVIALFVTFNKCSNIAYTSNIYSRVLNSFTECTAVTLDRTSLIDDMIAIKKAIEIQTNIDINSMSVEDYKRYILNKIAKTCEEKIYEGMEINGELFTYKIEDQQNIKTLFDTIMMIPQITALPYHSSGNLCRFYTRDEIITIYMTLMMRLIKITTYCNSLNMVIREMNTIEELDTVEYGMELPQDKKEVYDDIVAKTTEDFLSVISSITPPEEITEPDNPTEEPYLEEPEEEAGDIIE